MGGKSKESMPKTKCDVTFKQWGGVNRKENGSLLEGAYYHDLPEVMRD